MPAAMVPFCLAQSWLRQLAACSTLATAAFTAHAQWLPGLDLRGYLVSPPRTDLLANATANGDGTVTIDAGMHDTAANAFHAAVCASIGAHDITDQGPITFTAAASGAADAAVCAGSIHARPSATALPVLTDAQGRIYLPGPLPQCPPPRYEACTSGEASSSAAGPCSTTRPVSST